MRNKKTLWTDNDNGENVELYVAHEDVNEGEFVASKIKNAINNGKKASDFAVLMRVNALSHPYEQEFLKYNIPVKGYDEPALVGKAPISDKLQLTAALPSKLFPVLPTVSVTGVVNFDAVFTAKAV